MKTKILLSTIIVAFIASGIYFYISKSKQIEPPIPKFNNSLVGNWKIDSLYNLKDSVNLSVIVAAYYKDSTIFSFNKDSVLEVRSKAETNKANYYLAHDSLFINSDSLKSKLFVTFINDSLVNAIFDDRTTIILSKQN